MLTTGCARLGLRLAVPRPAPSAASQRLTSFTSKYYLTTASLQPSTIRTQPCQSTSTQLSKNTLRQRRHNSTTAPPTAATSPRNTQHPSAALDWNAFFRLRTSRRIYSLTSSLVGLVGSATGTAYFLVNYPDQSDYIVKLIPMDPIISTGIAVSAAMLIGWLLGPVFGNGLWRLLYRKRMPEFTIKERGFFERIKRHRVNPSGASTNNPVPDFYGEKVGSVAGYRRWLKDQRAFNRKRGGNYGPGI